MHGQLINMETLKITHTPKGVEMYVVSNTHAPKHKIIQNKPNVKGTFRDHSRDNALNFHQIRDFCILVMLLDNI